VPLPGFGRRVMPEIAVVAALEREVAPLVRNWRVSEQEQSGKKFRFFESRDAVVVCSGIGFEAARRATEAIIALHHPSLVLSVGFAGALDQSLRAGDLLEPRYVVDARDGTRTDTGSGNGVLISFPAVADVEQKAKLAKSYGAQAVDMEAAAVAKGAEARGLRFAAVKAISDEVGFAMPPMDRFIAPDGSFRGGSFALYAAARPFIWLNMMRLAQNSTKAAQALDAMLQARYFVSAVKEREEVI
jgi:adenosylhomocysteine nucleosidase